MSITDSKFAWVEGNFNIFIDEWNSCGVDSNREIEIVIKLPNVDIIKRNFNIYDPPEGKTPIIDLVEKWNLLEIVISQCKASLMGELNKIEMEKMQILEGLEVLSKPNDLSQYLVLDALRKDNEEITVYE